MSRVKSARRLHVENLEADVSELESRISNVMSEAKLLHEDGMRKAAEIMADAQKEADDALSSKLNAAREKSDMAIVAIKEKFRREFDHDISAKIDDAAGKVFNGLFGVLNEE
jgi:F0F1-type ATP synthase membrane subunit b/b'